MNSSRFLSFFGKSAEENICTTTSPINISDECNDLSGYIGFKSCSIDLGGGSKYARRGDGIHQSDVEIYTIIQWLNNNLQSNASTHELIQLVYTALKVFIEQIADGREKYYFQTLNSVTYANILWENQCNNVFNQCDNANVQMYLDEINENLNVISASFDTNCLKWNLKNLYEKLFETYYSGKTFLKLMESLINIAVHGDPKETDYHITLIKNDLNTFQWNLGKFDCGSNGCGVTYLDIGKFSISQWLLFKVNDMTWDHANLAFSLIASADVNMYVEYNKNQYQYTFRHMNQIMNGYFEFRKMCDAAYINCKKDDFLNQKVDQFASDELSDFLMVSKYQRPHIIASSRFLNSALSKIITNLYQSMEKVREGNTCKDEVELMPLARI